MGDDNGHSHKSLYRRTFDFKITRREFKPSFSPVTLFKFNFFLEKKLSNWILNQDSTSVYLMGRSNSPIEEYNINVSLETFLFCKYTCYKIARKLSMCGHLSNDDRARLVVFAWFKAYKTYMLKPIAGYTVLDLDFCLVLEEREMGIHRSTEAFLPKSNIAYPLNINNNDNNKCCSICLDDLPEEDGIEAMSLPCWHVFHRKCIKKWLKNTKSCPLCRFELPVATTS